MTALRRVGVLAVLLLSVAGCEAIVAPSGAISFQPVAITMRIPADMALSVITGLDCNIARLSPGQQYCQRIDHPPAPPFCTHSLAGIDCWTMADPFGYPQRQVADTPFGR